MKRAPIVLAVLLALTGCVSAPTQVDGLLPINETELYVKTLGSGEPIIVVHGGPVLDHGYLLPYLAPLAKSHRIIFYDQRMCGRSAATAKAETMRLATFAEDIEEIRDSLGLGNVHIMAHSFGGLIALRYALKYPDHLKSLILLDSIAASSDLWGAEQSEMANLITPAQSQDRRALMESSDFKAGKPKALAKVLRWSFKLQFHDPDKANNMPIFVPSDYGSRSATFGSMMVDLSDYDLYPKLKTIKAPTLVLYGADEIGASLGGKAILDAIPTAHWVSIENAGHFPFVENGEAFLNAVSDFLNGVR